MTKRNALEAREARQGEKMIELRVRFWTNDIAPGHDEVIPRHARTSGVVRIQRNLTHGIVPGKPKPFNSLVEIGAVMEKVLIEHGIVLRPSRRKRKYIDMAPKGTGHR